MAPWDNDYSSQLSDMLAPYQGAVRRAQAPYATIGQGFGAPQLPGFLSHIPFLGNKVEGINEGIQNAMPGVNQRLDNAFLTAAMTPGPRGPEGAGEGISRAFQGLVGAGQFRMNRAIQSAMMPYQMLQPRLQAEDTLAQIADRRSEVPYRQAMMKRAQSQSDFYDARSGALSNPKTVGQSHTDDNGSQWQEIFDPSAGKTRLFNPITQKHADEMPSEQQPSFKNQEKQQRIGAITLGSLASMAYPPADPAKGYTPKEAATVAESLANLQATAAGLRRKKETDVTTPIEKTKSFVANEQKGLYTDMSKQPETDYTKWLTNRAMSGNMEADPKKSYAAFQKEHNDYFSEKSGREEDFAQWQQSGAPERGQGFRDWRRNKSGQGTDINNSSKADLPSGDTRPSQKKALPF